MSTQYSTNESAHWKSKREAEVLKAAYKWKYHAENGSSKEELTASILLKEAILNLPTESE